MQVVGVRLPESIVSRVDEFAKSEKISRGNALRRLIERGLAGSEIDELDLARGIADMRLQLTDMASRLGAIETSSDVQVGMLRDLTDAAQGMQDATHEGHVRQEALLSMAAVVEVGLRILMKSQYPAEFPRLDDLGDQQKRLALEAAETEGGRVLGGKKRKGDNA